MKTQDIFALLFLSAFVFTLNKGASIEEQRAEEPIHMPRDRTADLGIGQLASKQLDKDIIDLMIIFKEDIKMNRIPGRNIETEELEQGDTASTMEEDSNNSDNIQPQRDETLPPPYKTNTRLLQSDNVHFIEEEDKETTTGIATKVIRLRQENFASHDFNKYHDKNFRLYDSWTWYGTRVLWMCSGTIKDLNLPHTENFFDHNFLCTGCYGNSFCEELCHNNIQDFFHGLDGYGTCNLDTIYALESYQPSETV